MRVLVIGGTGQVGGAAVAALASSGVDATVAARRRPPGGIALDLRDAAAVEAAAQGFEAVYFQTPLGPDETAVGLAAVAALRRAGVPKLVYLAIHNLEAMTAIPHFATKVPIKAAVLEDGRSVVIGANFFFQNDRLLLPAILHGGVYPLPVGSAGVFSVDTGDIGRAIANVLMRPDWDGQAVPVCGAEALTGPGMAATWSAAIGRPVHYGGDAVEPFVAGLARVIPGFGEWERADFAAMMTVTQARGCPATPAEIAASASVIGRPQRRYSDFVETLAGETA